MTIDAARLLGVSVRAARLERRWSVVPRFGGDDERRFIELARLNDRLAVLPERARRPVRVDDDF